MGRTETLLCLFFVCYFAYSLAQSPPVGGYGLTSLNFDPTAQTTTLNRVKLISPVYDTWTSFTIMAWINLDPRGNNTDRPIAMKGSFSPNEDGTENNGLASTVEFLLSVTPRGTLRFRMGCDLTLGFDIETTNVILPLGQWIHVAAVLIWENNVAQLYLNGALVNGAFQSWSQACIQQANIPGPYRTAYVPGGPLTPRAPQSTIQLGLYQILFDSFGPRKFFGLIEDFRVYNSSLTAAEIAANSQSGLTGDEAKLLSWHSFNEGSGTSTVSPWPFSGPFRSASASAITVSGTVQPATLWSSSTVHLNHPRFTVYVPGIPKSIRLTAISTTTPQTGISYRITRLPSSGVLRGTPIGETIERDLVLGDELSGSGGFPVITYTSNPNFNGEDVFSYRAFVGSLVQPRDVDVPLSTGCPTVDRCGVCNGNDSCVGCDGIPAFPPNVPKTRDACGECGGNSSSCRGCDGIIYVPPLVAPKFDGCGECGGNNSTCRGCDGLLYPPPLVKKEKDLCGECGGNNSLCTGCDGIITPPPGLPKIRDRCGVCGGNGESCLGCDGTPGAVYDECGVCAGNGTSCADCDGIPNGPHPPNECGWCPGDPEAPDWCLDCAGCPFGNAVRDVCDECNGDNSTCSLCQKDICGVCDGNGTSCLGGECGYTTIQKDACGVCNGDNSTCQCVFYKHFHIARMDCVLIDFSTQHSLDTIQILLQILHGASANLNNYDMLPNVETAVAIGEEIRDLNNFVSTCVVDYCEQLADIIPKIEEYIT